MNDRRALRDSARAQAAIDATRILRPHAAVAREMRRIRRAEIFGSTTLAGSSLSLDDVDALLDAGRALGDHPFDDYILVRAYAAAADSIAERRALQAGDPSPLLAVDELRQLHMLATAGSPLRGGAWRQGNPISAAGIVAPAAWLVAREVTTLVDRFGRGPGANPLAVWLARFLGRFARVLPFEGANGRVARLAANLMLRRIDVAPLVFERRDRTSYATAVGSAELGDTGALTRLVAGALTRTAHRLSAAAPEGEPLSSLRELAGDDYGALAKAAQRGRLRTLVRNGRYFTTPAWIAEYRS